MQIWNKSVIAIMIISCIIMSDSSSSCNNNNSDNQVTIINISRIKKIIIKDSYKSSMFCMVYEYPRKDFKDSENFLDFHHLHKDWKMLKFFKL